jgi:hypothetical protein
VTDLDLLIAGAMVTFIAVAGAYVAIRHRANDAPVDSYKAPDMNRHGYDPATASSRLNAAAESNPIHLQN